MRIIVSYGPDDNLVDKSVNCVSNCALPEGRWIWILNAFGKTARTPPSRTGNKPSRNMKERPFENGGPTLGVTRATPGCPLIRMGSGADFGIPGF